MPYIEPRRNQQGKITSFRITVSDGYDLNGKQIRRRLLWTPPKPGMSERQMEKEATAAAYKFEEQISQGYQLGASHRFSEYAQYVLELKERTGVKPTTIDRYIELLVRVNPVLGHMDLEKIRPHHLNTFYMDLQKNGVRMDGQRAVAKRTLKTTMAEMCYSRLRISRESGIAPSTVNAAVKGTPVSIRSAEAIAKVFDGTVDEFFKCQDDKQPLSNKTVLEHHRLISTILAQAEKEMIITYNPAAKATPPKQKKTTPDYYQPDEMDEILEALETAPLRWRAITYLMIDTGCRRGEVMGLKWDKVNLETGLIVIDTTILYTPKHGTFESDTKTGTTRAMILAPQTLALIKKWRGEQLLLKLANGDRWTETNYVFTRDDGNPMHPDSITNWLNRFSKKHDLPHIHPHAFRHTAASTMIANGVDIVTAANELGHASPTTTANIYAHQIAIARARAADVRAGVFSGKNASASRRKRA